MICSKENLPVAEWWSGSWTQKSPEPRRTEPASPRATRGQRWIRLFEGEERLSAFFWFVSFNLRVSIWDFEFLSNFESHESHSNELDREKVSSKNSTQWSSQWYVRPVRGCTGMLCWWCVVGEVFCCFGFDTFVLLLANSSRIVWGTSGSNLTPCCLVGGSVDWWRRRVKKSEEECKREWAWGRKRKTKKRKLMFNPKHKDLAD